ncbi:MAG: hypothetical protein NUV52_03130 [Candidatus Roizmanbacteria bacterium]|nr:hypothetical protein [Candidatus Roizmanbacteria bacterium]
MHSIDTFRHTPLKDIARNSISSLAALALLTGSGLPLHAEQAIQPIGFTASNETASSAENSVTLNLNDDYYAIEQGTHATFYPFDNDQFNSTEVGPFTLVVSPGAEFTNPRSINWGLQFLDNQYRLYMQFHELQAGDYTVKYSVTPKNKLIESDEAMVHVHVYDPADRVAMFLPGLYAGSVASE